MTQKTTTFEARGEFDFTFYIEKAVATEEMVDSEKALILEGVASTTNIDHDNERMSKEALQAMVDIINTKSVPLRVEHSKSENAVIGSVFKAWLDERNQMHIRAALDKSHPVSPILHDSMKTLGKKMGFSVGGLVKRAVREFSEATGKLVKTFYDVELKEVSVTPRPANYDSWAVTKSIAANEVEAEDTRKTFYNEFLYENPQLDYLQAFAKSVPDEAWKKVEINKNNKDTMTTEDETAKKTDEKSEDTEKAVTRGEFKVLVKGIETLAKTIEALATGKFLKEGLSGDAPKDQANPSKDKPEDESPAAKMGDGPKDQVAPDKEKPKDESPAAKSSTEGTDTEGTREKTSKKDTDETYDMETVTRSITSLENLTKRIKNVKKDSSEETKEKTTDDEKKDETTKKTDDEKDETEKGIHPLDKFVVVMTKTMEAMVDKMEKSGMTVLGFEKNFVDKIVNDPEIQKSIQELVKVPGAKRSMSMGVPFMVTKEGRRFQLTASDAGESTVEKSRTADKNVSFKDLYKRDYSSIREGQEE